MDDNERALNEVYRECEINRRATRFRITLTLALLVIVLGIIIVLLMVFGGDTIDPPTISTN